MPALGPTSQAKLNSCHPDLIRLFNEVVKSIDCTILFGHRTLEEQQAAFRAGKSHCDGITKKSNHQSVPSQAVDVSPWPLVMHGVSIWEDPIRFAYFAGQVKAKADALGIKVRWGGDWNGDGSTRDSQLVDMPHFEVI